MTYDFENVIVVDVASVDLSEMKTKPVTLSAEENRQLLQGIVDITALAMALNGVIPGLSTAFLEPLASIRDALSDAFERRDNVERQAEQDDRLDGFSDS